MAKGKTATIYRESKHAFGVCHAFGTIWKCCGFLTSAGTPIASGPILAALLQAIHLPFKIAIVHCPAHTKEMGTVSLGNDRAYRTVKYAAQNGPPYVFSTQFITLPLSLSGIIDPRRIGGYKMVLNNYQVDVYWAKQTPCDPFSFNVVACTYLPSGGTDINTDGG